MRHYKHIFFDLDRTLWDFDTNSAQTLLELITYFKLEEYVPEKDRWLESYRKHNIKVWNRFAHVDLKNQDGFKSCLSYTLYRPRDIIVLLNTTFSHVARSGRHKIVKEDIELEQFEQRLGTPPQEQRIGIGDFTELNGYEFEDYLKRMFELLGYTAVQTPTTGDQGADLILSKEDEKIVVQAKKYEGKVSNNAVQEIAAAKNHYDADKAMVVTNSSFTKSAMELALSNDVELWDGTKLRSIIRDLES